MDVLSSGKTSFKVEVPYRLIETGPKGRKPLLVYLHGAGQNLEQFQTLCKPLFELNAYHLFIQAPYVNLHTVQHRAKWGYEWYLYNGKQGSFLKSMEYTAEFIQGVIDHLTPLIKVSRVCLLGYSMGGYMAGYWGFTRWKHTHEIIIIGGRLKTEFVKTKYAHASHIQLLAIHAKDDEIVASEAQEKEIAYLKERGLNGSFVHAGKGHKLSSVQLTKAVNWLIGLGYEKIP